MLLGRAVECCPQVRAAPASRVHSLAAAGINGSAEAMFPMCTYTTCYTSLPLCAAVALSEPWLCV